MVKKAIIRFSGFLAISTMLFASQSFAMIRKKRQASSASSAGIAQKSQLKPTTSLSRLTSKKKQPTPPPFPAPTRKPVLPEHSATLPLDRSKRAAPSQKSFNDQLWEMTNSGSAEGVEIMLAMGANPHYKVNNSSPLFLACKKENAGLIKLFAQHANLDITECVDGKWSPLLKAIEKNNPPLLEILIQSHHNKDESFYAALGSALEQAHVHKKPAIFNCIAHKLPMEELICWFNIFSRRNSTPKADHEQAKYHVYTVIRERLSQPALSHAKVTGFERESQENSRNHAQHDNRLTFIEELRRHAFTTACSSAIKRETLEDARSLITNSEQTRNVSGENSESESVCESVETTSTSLSIHSLDSMPEQPIITVEEKENEDGWELISNESLV